MNRRRFLQTSATALSGLALSSCGWRLAQVQPTSVADPRKLYIYTWAGYTDGNLLQEFTRETGIEVVADVFDSNEAMLARLQAGGGGAYSIIYPSDYMVFKMRELDLLLELDGDRLPGLKQLFPKFKDPIYDPGNRHSVPLSWGTTGLVYDSDRLSPEPDDWTYLWTHKQTLSRQMTLVNDVREVFGLALKELGYSYNATDPEQIRQAYQRLVELKPSIASFTSDAWRNRILRGSLLLAMTYSADANEVIEEDDTLAYVVPASGSSIWMDTLVIPKFAPNVEGAYKWIDFILRPPITAEIVKRLSFATPNREAYELLPPDVQNNPTLFPSEEILARCEGLEVLPESVLEVYDRYWTELTSG